MATWLDVKAVIALCALLVSGGAFYWNWYRTRKRVFYDYWVAALVNESVREVGGRLEVRFDGEVVKDVKQVGIRIKNGGTLRLGTAPPAVPALLFFASAVLLPRSV
jgi:hypothetical protein